MMETATVEPVLFVLLVKLGIMASFASLLVMSRTFRKLLSDAAKDAEGKFVFALPIAALLVTGVVARVVLGYDAGDVAIESAFVLGLIEGLPSGILLGMVLGLAAFLGGEYLALPLGAVYGCAGGLLRRKRPAAVDPFDFSLFPPAILYRALSEKLRHDRLYWPLVPFAVFLGLEALRMILARSTGLVFALTSRDLASNFLLLLVAPAFVGIPLKIWDAVRMEKRIEDLSEQSAQARLETLKGQIHPHFLFNSLNTISTLVRTDPELGRALILKLAGLLRRLLHQGDEMVPLGQEIEFVDDYLAIEQARFGARLRVERRIDPAALTARVPRMIVQPIVENAVRHGIGPKVDGGLIEIECRLKDGWVEIAVRDDGVGMDAGRAASSPAAADGKPAGMGLGLGLGVRNVEERLRATYGERFRFKLEGRPGGGAQVVLGVPAEAP